MTNKSGHPAITNAISEKLFQVKFIDYVSNKLENICSGDNKEKNLKIALISALLSHVDIWVSSGTAGQFNPCVATELALPCLDSNQAQKDGLCIQYFNWINGSINPYGPESKIFLPPTDIVINPTGWLPDPIFSYSLLLGIELKVFANDVSIGKDIKKGIHFLQWQKNYVNTLFISQNLIHVKYHHLQDGLDDIKKKFYFFLIGLCCHKEKLNLINSQLDAHGASIEYNVLSNNVSGLYIIRINLK